MDVDLLWKDVTNAFPVINEELTDSNYSEDVFKESVHKLKQLNVGCGIIDYILSAIEIYMRKHVASTFWEKFQAEANEENSFQLFQDAIQYLYGVVTSFVPQLRRFDYLRTACGYGKPIYGETDISEAFRVMLRATLHSVLPRNYQDTVRGFYEKAFKVFANNDAVTDHDDSVDDINCAGCCMELDFCQCQNIVMIFHHVNDCLTSMGLLEKLAGQVITSLIQDRINLHVKNTSKGSFDVSHIRSLEEWLNSVVVSWLIRIYCRGSAKIPVNDIRITEAIQRFKQKLEYYLYETYTLTRIEQLFNIIIEYPDSQPAVEDLKHCLPRTELRPRLVSTLQSALQTRLLHPGVNTPDILTAYVAAIKALRHLDGSGVLLETITEPVRLYLRGREDTVRCVVTSLTDDGASELSEELARGDPVQQRRLAGAGMGARGDVIGGGGMEGGAGGGVGGAGGGGGVVEMSEDIINWETWMPDPVDADPNKPSTVRRTNDIITMLVDIYGSKELFVNEYRTLLADRLLTQAHFKPDKEIRNLEFLKMRFGESQLHNCEVMLKDLSDSKRINAHIQGDKTYSESQVFPTSAMIVSAQFWPPFKDETLELPGLVKEQMDRYTKVFEAYKGNRTLYWKPHLGHVNLDIELAERTVNLTVSPIHAAIIMHFQDKDCWTLEEMSNVIKIPPSVLRRKMSYWQSQGIIREQSQDQYRLIEKAAETESHSMTHEVCEYDETESPMTSTSDQREEELQVFWSYIVGMLTNLDSLPLERIHQMLKMFASQGPAVECSTTELRHFLDRKVREHKLVFVAGFYRLPKG